MHKCPECQMDCDCDGEDTWNDAAREECVHPDTEECEEAQNFDDDDDIGGEA